MLKHYLNEKGFTLIELIVVIAILAVLIGVITPQYLKYVEKSKRVVDVNTARQIRDSFDRVFAIDNPSMLVNGEYKAGVAWGKDKKMPVIGEENTFLDHVFIDIGSVPQSATFKDFVWVVNYNVDFGYVEKITLLDNSTHKAYELYPNADDFINP